mmetsp:Transcript_24447/g.66399  ORF Transcript_24447/g.66399 Transcript_24447/m.66399 type:complete len:283 (+) Transcript_24447:1035-1883(+)
MSHGASWQWSARVWSSRKLSPPRWTRPTRASWALRTPDSTRRSPRWCRPSPSRAGTCRARRFASASPRSSKALAFCLQRGPRAASTCPPDPLTASPTSAPWSPPQSPRARPKGRAQARRRVWGPEARAPPCPPRCPRRPPPSLATAQRVQPQGVPRTRALPAPRPPRALAPLAPLAPLRPRPPRPAAVPRHRTRHLGEPFTHITEPAPTTFSVISVHRHWTRPSCSPGRGQSPRTAPGAPLSPEPPREVTAGLPRRSCRNTLVRTPALVRGQHARARATPAW